MKSLPADDMHSAKENSSEAVAILYVFRKYSHPNWRLGTCSLLSIDYKSRQRPGKMFSF